MERFLGKAEVKSMLKLLGESIPLYKESYYISYVVLG